MARLCTDSENNLLRNGSAWFDPWNLVWKQAGDEAANPSNNANGGSREAIGPEAAMRWLFRTQNVRRVPIAVIGAKEASQAECLLAEALGHALGETGYTVMTGGRGGVMEAASRGAARAGGIVIGVLPDEEWQTANSHITIPLATGIGPTRNSIIARAARILVAVGGGYGTITEMAYGLHYDRRVFTLGDAPKVPGAVRCAKLGEVMAAIAKAFLAVE